MATNHVIAIRNYDGFNYSENNNPIPIDHTLDSVRRILRDIRKPTPIIRYPIKSSRETEALVESIRKSIFADKNSANANGILSNPPNDRQLRDDINQFFTPSNVLILVVGLQWMVHLRSVGLDIPQLDHSSNIQEQNAAIPRGSVHHFYMGGY